MDPFPLPVSAAAQHLQVSVHGGSRPLVVRLGDGRPALVKLKGNPQSTRALAGELIATLLGRRVGAALPEPVLVRLDPGDGARLPPLCGRPWSPGLQFGVVYHPEAAPLRDLSRVPALRNLARLPLTALLETWVHNTDLKGDHVLAVRAAGGREFRVVDHGHVFPGGPVWTEEQLCLRVDRTPGVRALTRLARAAGRRWSFAPAVARCRSVSDAEVDALLGRVPDEWGLRRDERAAIRVFLLRRRARLARWADGLATLWNA